ncbi:MAG: ATP-binding protein [Telluria sp.]
MTDDDIPSCLILLIDDTPGASDYVKECIEGSLRVALRLKPQPEQVVALARDAAASVVLLVLGAGRADGLELLRQLRAERATEQLPVIVLACADDADMRAIAFDAGASDYLVKWPDRRELTARIRYHGRVCVALRRAQAMQAIGRVASGVAHDINNVLQIIGGNLEVVKLLGGVSDNVRTRIDSALSGVERGASLSSQLLAVAGGGPLQGAPVNPGRVLHDMDQMLRRVIGPHISTVSDVDSALWSISADPCQLQDVILNLAINARDAMPDGGTLTICALNVPHGSPHMPGNAFGDYVMLEVADTGCGMAPAVLALALQPFFTTRQPGQGPGLGLSMANDFVRQGGGELVLKSAPGQGASVKLFLRRCAASAPGGALDAQPAAACEAALCSRTVELHEPR